MQNPQQEEFKPKSQNNKFPILVFAVAIIILFGFIGLILLGKNILNKQGKIAEIYVQENYGITINPEKKIQNVSPTFFGTNLYWASHGMEANESGYHYGNEVMTLLENLNLGSIRFPGGCASDSYQWKHSFPDEPSYNPWYTYGMAIDQYIDLNKTLGLMPYYTINMQEDHLNQKNCVAHNEYPGTIAEIKELAQYFKEKIPDKTIYWELSNEPWGWSNWNLVDYVNRAKLYAQAVKEIYPNARFTWSWAIRGTTPDQAASEWRNFIQYLKLNVPSYFDALQYHDYYVFDPINTDSIAKKRLDKLKQLLDETGKNIEIDVTEFNLWCDCDGAPCTWCGTVGHSLIIAQIYRQYLLHDVKFAHLHHGVRESDQNNPHEGETIISGGHGYGRPPYDKSPKTQPIYYVQKLLADHIGTEIVESSTIVENVDVLTSRKDNTLYTLIINKNNEIKHLPINLESGVTLKNPARAFIVGNGVNPHQLTDLGAKEIRPGYVQVRDNVVDFSAEPYSISVVEIDYSQSPNTQQTQTKSVYRGWCPSLWEYLVTDDQQELENNECEEIKTIGKVLKNQIEGTEPLQRFWLVGLGEHFQTAIPSEKQHVRTTTKYQAKDDRILGFVYITPKEGTIPLYQAWCGDGWLKKHFFTTNEDEIKNVTNLIDYPDWKCQNKAIAGYLLP